MSNNINNENTTYYNDIRGKLIMKDSYVHVRVNSLDKEKAEKILKELGTDLSSVVNMLLKQIQIKGGIPFNVNDEAFILENIKATMAMENMILNQDDINLLKKYQGNGSKEDEEIISSIINEYKEDDNGQ